MSDDPNQIRAKLESEYAKVRKDLGELHVAYEALMAAGPEDDISELLKDLEDEVKEATFRLRRVGYDRMAGYLEGGIEGWRAAGQEVRQSKLIGQLDLERVLAGVRAGAGGDLGHHRQRRGVDLDLAQRRGQARGAGAGQAVHEHPVSRADQHHPLDAVAERRQPGERRRGDRSRVDVAGVRHDQRLGAGERAGRGRRGEQRVDLRAQRVGRGGVEGAGDGGRAGDRGHASNVGTHTTLSLIHI